MLKHESRKSAVHCSSTCSLHWSWGRYHTRRLVSDSEPIRRWYVVFQLVQFPNWNCKHKVPWLFIGQTVGRWTDNKYLLPTWTTSWITEHCRVLFMLVLIRRTSADCRGSCIRISVRQRALNNVMTPSFRGRRSAIRWSDYTTQLVLMRSNQDLLQGRPLFYRTEQGWCDCTQPAAQSWSTHSGNPRFACWKMNASMSWLILVGLFFTVLFLYLCS